MLPKDEPRLDPRLLAMKPSPGHQDYSPRETTSRLRAARAWWRKRARETVHPSARHRPAHDGDFITNRPDQPWLLWKDTDGRIHVEEQLSAEELIRRWEETHDQESTG